MRHQPADAPELPHAVLDRATAVLVAQACGDALGVPDAPGERSHDTQMSGCVARVDGLELRAGEARSAGSVVQLPVGVVADPAVVRP